MQTSEFFSLLMVLTCLGGLCLGSLVFGAVTAAIYSSKGRPAVTGFVLGFFLWIGGPIFALTRSDLKREMAFQAARAAKEQRRTEIINNWISTPPQPIAPPPGTATRTGAPVLPPRAEVPAGVLASRTLAGDDRALADILELIEAGEVFDTAEIADALTTLFFSNQATPQQKMRIWSIHERPVYQYVAIEHRPVMAYSEERDTWRETSQVEEVETIVTKTLAEYLLPRFESGQFTSKK